MAQNNEDASPLQGEELARYVAMMGGDLNAMKGHGAAMGTLVGAFFLALREQGLSEERASEQTCELIRVQFKREPLS